MTITAFCTACGEDCSKCYGTWRGEPYHISCIPSRPRTDNVKEIKPHFYLPDYQAQGDCRVCGHGADHPSHVYRR